MTGAKKGVVVGLWAATILAAFGAGRLTAPLEFAPVPDAARADFGAAVRAALGEIDGVDRAERTASLMQQLNADNVAEAAAVYDQMLNILDPTDIRPFAIAWARFDPDAALDHTLRWPLREKQQIGAGAAIEGWALRDPRAALQAYEQTRTRFAGLDDELFLNLLTGWVYSGQEGLDEYVANVPKSKQDSAITRVVAKIIRHGGIDATMRWVNSIALDDAYEQRFKKTVFRRGIRMVARWDPERSAAWAMEHVGQGYAVDAPRIVAEQWGPRDGRAAIQWVREHPSEELRDGACREAFRTWLSSDRASASEWLESESLTAFHDPAIWLYAKDLSERAPEEAIVWCERVIEADPRLSCLKTVAAKWYQRDPLAAETWLQQSPLDEEARRAARTPPIQKRPRGARPGRPPSNGPT